MEDLWRQINTFVSLHDKLCVHLKEKKRESVCVCVRVCVYCTWSVEGVIGVEDCGEETEWESTDPK